MAGGALLASRETTALLLTAALWAPAVSAAAETDITKSDRTQSARIAVTRAVGPKRSAPKKLTAGVIAGLRKSGFSVVAGRRLRRRAAKAGLSARNPRLASSVGATYWLNMRVKRRKKKYIVVAKLYDAAGRLRHQRKGRYRKGRSARRSGVILGKKLATWISREETSKVSSLAQSAARASPRRSEASHPPRPLVAPLRREATDLSPATPSQSSVASVTPSRFAPDTGELNTWRFRLTAGTQVASTYAVAVADADTGLTYALNPIPVLVADLAFDWPGSGWGAGGDFTFSPVSFAIDVQPPLDPAEPSGALLGASGHIFYEATLARFGRSRLLAAPLLGVEYSNTSVQSQGERSVLLSSTALDVHAGGRFRWIITSRFAVESEVRVGWLVDYSES
ncbi:MAG: hypothetical protein AAF449_24665, partial [Myxococcota bacterium]